MAGRNTPGFQMLHYRGVRLNSCKALVYVGLGPVAARARVLVHEVLDSGAQAAARGGARLCIAGT